LFSILPILFLSHHLILSRGCVRVCNTIQFFLHHPDTPLLIALYAMCHREKIRKGHALYSNGSQTEQLSAWSLHSEGVPLVPLNHLDVLRLCHYRKSVNAFIALGEAESMTGEFRVVRPAWKGEMSRTGEYSAIFILFLRNQDLAVTDETNVCGMRYLRWAANSQHNPNTSILSSFFSIYSPITL
jgi:hypothetical protein